MKATIRTQNLHKDGFYAGFQESTQDFIIDIPDRKTNSVQIKCAKQTGQLHCSSAIRAPHDVLAMASTPDQDQKSSESGLEAKPANERPSEVVIISLIEGSRIYNQKLDLHTTLRERSHDAETIFALRLRRTESRHKKQAARIFTVYRHWQMYQRKREAAREYFPDLCTTNLSFALDVNASRNLAMHNQPLFEAEMIRRRNMVEEWLVYSCGGLLEVPNENLDLARHDSQNAAIPDKVDELGFKNPKIQYVHKSVPAFLMGDEVIRKTMERNAEDKFVAEDAILQSLVLQIKTWTSKTNRIEVGCPWDLISAALQYAHSFERVSGRAQVYLLDELDKAVAEHFQKRVIEKNKCRYNGRVVYSDSHWSEFWPTDFHRTLRWRDNFLALAVRHNLHFYVEAKLGDDSPYSEKKDGRPLLDYAFLPLSGLSTFMVSPDLIKLLLACGANPNQTFDNFSPWVNFLRHVMENQGMAREHSIWAVEIVENFLERGADPNAEFGYYEISGDLPQARTVIDVIQTVFLDGEANDVLGLTLLRNVTQSQRAVSRAQETLRRIQRDDASIWSGSLMSSVWQSKKKTSLSKLSFHWFSKKQPAAI